MAADGTWTFPNQRGWRGGLGNLTVIDTTATVPTQPTLLLTAEGIVTLIFGSAQPAVRAAAAGATGAPRGAVALPRYDAPAGSGPAGYTASHDHDARYTLSASADGRQKAGAFGDGGFMTVEARGRAGAQLTVPAHRHGLTYDPRGGEVPVKLTAGVVKRDGMVRTAVLSTRLSGSGDELSFDRSGRGVTIRHRGATATATLTLTRAGGSGVPERFVLAAVSPSARRHGVAECRGGAGLQAVGSC